MFNIFPVFVILMSKIMNGEGDMRLPPPLTGAHDSEHSRYVSTSFCFEEGCKFSVEIFSFSRSPHSNVIRFYQFFFEGGEICNIMH